MNILVSVIIPVYNEEKNIGECLDALAKQSYKNLEVLVGDDSSTDRSLIIIKKYASQFDYMSAHTFKHSGPGSVRNKLVAIAKGDIVVFIDADMIADTYYIEKLVAPILTGVSNGTFTTDEQVKNKENVWARCWNYEYLHENTLSRIPSNHPDTSPVFRSIKKEEFLKCGGYSEIGYGEDWTLSQKVGYEATRARDAVIYHYNPSSMSEVITQTMWFATRPYKYGQLGRIFGLIRASMPISILVGLIGVVRYREPFYFLFKLVYDTAIICGIVQFWITKKYAA